MSPSSRWEDRIDTPINACSLEIFWQHVQRDNNVYFPLIIGCYQLNEKGLDEEENEKMKGNMRSGELRLHMASKSLDNSNKIQFGKACHILESDSGVLDGKWYQATRSFDHSSSFDVDDAIRSCCSPIYASACASGRINVYKLLHSSDISDGGKNYRLNHVGSSSTINDNNLISSSKSDAICLSLDWDKSSSVDPVQTRIVSSYSDGQLAIHDINLNTSKDDSLIHEAQRWNAHTLFGHPSEVWTTCFATNAHYDTYQNTVISGGDDCKLKLWDLRSTSNPSHILGKNEFEAGVTAVSYHPLLEHVFASGSYDECLRIWDMRMLSEGIPMSKCDDVGGGIWRTKWHPQEKNKMLVAAMHGGCCILDIQNLVNDESSVDDNIGNISVKNRFTAHESMAYGADWLYCANQFDAAASCSFYDRKCFIWS